MNIDKKKVLFVCTGNAGRSQLAEVFFSKMSDKAVSVFSGGVDPWKKLHPMAVKLLREKEIDITKLYPKHVRSFKEKRFDWVITIGDRARDEAPRLLGNPRRVHWDISDPADADGTSQAEDVFRKTLTAIEKRLPYLMDAVKTSVNALSLHLAPGISTCVVRPNKFDPAIHLPLIAKAGFACIELNCYLGSDDFPWDNPYEVRELRRIAEDTNVRIYSVHAEGGIGLSSNSRTEQLAVDLYKAYADLAAELSAVLVPIHAFLPELEDRSIAEDQLRSSLEQLSRHILPMPCYYSWENEARRLSTQEHLEWIRQLNPGAFGFTLDTGHSHKAGTTEKYLSMCDGLLCSLHLDDNLGKSDKHWIPGKGSFQWNGFVKQLESKGYVGPLMLEILAMDRQNQLGAVLKEARESINFIKSLD
jgi:protein-tyrosine-phosphatase/sugar phosphate isomerase/epimerase